VEDGQVVTLMLLNDGTNVDEAVTPAVTGIPWSYTVTGGTIPAGSDGSYTVQADVTDLAGNPASDTQAVTLDETAPSITISAIARSEDRRVGKEGTARSSSGAPTDRGGGEERAPKP